LPGLAPEGTHHLLFVFAPPENHRLPCNVWKASCCRWCKDTHEFFTHAVKLVRTAFEEEGYVWQQELTDYKISFKA
jgi:hypothetical protein